MTLTQPQVQREEEWDFDIQASYAIKEEIKNGSNEFMEACDSENEWDVLATSTMLEYLEESYESEEEWDMTESSLFESAQLEEVIQEQMNSSDEVENISPSVLMEKEDVEEVKCKAVNNAAENKQQNAGHCGVAKAEEPKTANPCEHCNEHHVLDAELFHCKRNEQDAKSL